MVSAVQIIQLLPETFAFDISIVPEQVTCHASRQDKTARINGPVPRIAQEVHETEHRTLQTVPNRTVSEVSFPLIIPRLLVNLMCPIDGVLYSPPVLLLPATSAFDAREWDIFVSDGYNFV